MSPQMKRRCKGNGAWPLLRRSAEAPGPTCQRLGGPGRLDAFVRKARRRADPGVNQPRRKPRHIAGSPSQHRKEPTVLLRACGHHPDRASGSRHGARPFAMGPTWPRPPRTPAQSVRDFRKIDAGLGEGSGRQFVPYLASQSGQSSPRPCEGCSRCRRKDRNERPMHETVSAAHEVRVVRGKRRSMHASIKSDGPPKATRRARCRR